MLSSQGDDAEELGPHKTPLTRRFLTVVLRRRNSMFQQVDPLKIEVNELQFLKKKLGSLDGNGNPLFSKRKSKNTEEI